MPFSAPLPGPARVAGTAPSPARSLPRCLPCAPPRPEPPAAEALDWLNWLPVPAPREPAPPRSGSGRSPARQRVRLRGGAEAAAAAGAQVRARAAARRAGVRRPRLAPGEQGCDRGGGLAGAAGPGRALRYVCGPSQGPSQLRKGLGPGVRAEVGGRGQ